MGHFRPGLNRRPSPTETSALTMLSLGRPEDEEEEEIKNLYHDPSISVMILLSLS